MCSLIDAPVTLGSQMLAQNVTIVIGIVIDSNFGLWEGRYATSTKEANITNGQQSMSQWKFESILRPRGELTVVSELVNVVNYSEVKLMLRGVVLDSRGKDSYIRSATWGELKKHEKLNFNVGNARTEGWSRFKRSCNRYNNMVTARLDMTIEYINQTNPYKEAAFKRFSEVSLQDFSEAMKGLLASPSFTNASIVCADGVEVAVNKEILASRSLVFEAMFRHDMKEAATGVVHVTDICGKSMKVLVEYLSTGQLDESWNNPDVVTHLTMAANKYGIESLREFLDDWLGEETFVQSTLDLLNMVADCGYPKAERKIAVNVARRAKGAKTRDQFLASIGMKREPLDKLRKERAEKELMRWMNNQLGQRVATESTLELIDIAADEGLDLAERRLVEELGNRLEPARSRDEVLKVLGTEEK